MDLGLSLSKKVLKVKKLMMSYDEWDKYHSIVRATLLYEKLVKIHLLVDENGRKCRLIINMDLMRNAYV